MTVKSGLWCPARSGLAPSVHRNHSLHRRVSSAEMPPALETLELKKQYRMGATTVTALDGVTMSVERGQFVALLGTSGSGKSTLLNLIAGLDQPTSGALQVLGQDMARLSPNELSLYRRKRVGIIFQSF